MISCEEAMFVRAGGRFSCSWLELTRFLEFLEFGSLWTVSDTLSFVKRLRMK